MDERIKQLGVLRLNHFDIKDHGAMALSEVLFRDRKRFDGGIYCELHVRNNSLGPAGAVYLLEASTNLTVLDFSYNSLGYKGAQLRKMGMGPHLKKLLQRNNNLLSLILSHNRLTDYDVKFIAEGLKTNTSLKKLDLSNNEMGPTSGIRLADALSDNRNLKELYVGWNLLEGTGTKALMHELKQNGILEIVDLSWTGMRDDNGGVDIGELLASSATLRWLNLSHNDLRARSGLDIAKSLETNKVLTHLNLSYNGLGDKAVLEIAKAVRENTTLEYLDLRATGAGEDTGKEVEVTRKRHQERMGKREDVVIHFSTSMIQSSDKLKSDKWV